MNREEAFTMVLLSRGVEAGDECQECYGLGTRSYPNTSTWMRGIGGQLPTNGVCDACWGTGDRHKAGADLRRIYAVERSLRSQVSRLQKRVNELREDR